MWRYLAILVVTVPLVHLLSGCNFRSSKFRANPNSTANVDSSLSDYEPPDPVGDFAFTDQDGQVVRRSDLLGKVWVASFLFTRCNTLCPQISGSLARLQTELTGREGVLLVSFSVDPEHDTPSVLKDYAQRFGADPRRWRLLTGARDKIYHLIQTSFQLGVAQNQGTARTPGNEVTHSPRLVLVDKRGHIRGYFDGRAADDDGRPLHDLPKLRQKIEALLQEAP
jgi:cytochrome oxidase Cu insertion factor (SCO1/SenC/PrrC family)